MTKTYDKEYFSRWYQDRVDHKHQAEALQRKVALACASAEYFLERPIKTVLDVGAGIGLWRSQLLKLRPKLDYLGMDSSEFAVRRYGKSRNLFYAQITDLANLRPCPPVDLLVCSDVLHYIPTAALKCALPGLAELCAGVAFLEIYCREDEIEGDLKEFQPRSEKFYRRQLNAVGFQQIGTHLWLSPSYSGTLTALETADCRTV